MWALSGPASAVLLLFKHGGALEPSPTQGGLIPPHGGGGVQHVCFAIPLASLDAWHTQLEKEHVLIESKVTQYFGGISLYFRDPDGHSIELATLEIWPSVEMYCGGCRSLYHICRGLSVRSQRSVRQALIHEPADLFEFV